jgi:hypothetical protein
VEALRPLRVGLSFPHAVTSGNSIATILVEISDGSAGLAC